MKAPRSYLSAALVLLALLPASPAFPAILTVDGSVTRLAENTYHFQVNWYLQESRDLYELFDVPHVSDYGSPVNLYPWPGYGMCRGDFGTVFNGSETVGETPDYFLFYTASHAFAFDAQLSPRAERLILEVGVLEDWVAEYYEPGTPWPIRGFVGTLEDTRFFVADLPLGIGVATEIVATPEPSPLLGIAMGLIVVLLSRVRVPLPDSHRAM